MKRPSNFVVCLLMAIVAIVGLALLPRIDVGVNPPQRQGKTLTVDVRWQGVSAKVMENSVTSVLEGVLSGVKGVENVSSESFFGKCRIKVRLKEQADVSAIRFEMSSLLRQVYSRLPEGVGYPTLSGGETVGSGDDKGERKVLLTYHVNADMPEAQIGDYINQHVMKRIRQIEGVKNVTLSGEMERYIELNYDPQQLENYGLSSVDIIDAVRKFTGQKDIVGDVEDKDGQGGSRRRTLYLSTSHLPLAEIPVTTSAGSVVYLNNLVSQEIKMREPQHYYRINGLNTVNLNIEVDGDANAIYLSSSIRRQIDKISDHLPDGFYLTLAFDAAEEERAEMTDLVSRSLLSLGILLLFVWITNRRWRYLAIITLSLSLNLLLAIILYWLLNLRLHVYSMAGMAVSLSLIIDATIVMADHYGYYHNRKAFLAILAAMLTTIGSLVSVYFLPDNWQNDLYDFVRIICINLLASLFVALLFVPTLVDVLHYDSRKQKHLGGVRRVVKWNRFYLRYVRVVQRRKWLSGLLVLLAFCYTLHLFIDHIDYQAEREPDRKLALHIQGMMPQGGTASELNQKVVIVENKLKKYPEIKRFVTDINGRRANIDVEFQDSCQNTGAPYTIEQQMIAQLIGIGGADWATYGVSQMGFSNSLNLQHRNNSIWVSGYNYDHVNRYSDDLSKMLAHNTRVRDLIVKAPDKDIEADELFMDYDKERMSVYQVSPKMVYSELSNLLYTADVGKYDDGEQQLDVVLRPLQTDRFDVWQVNNSYIRANGQPVKASALMNIGQRAAKNYILKRNQEYLLSVEFNVLGSYLYTDEYVKQVVDSFNHCLPMGYHCQTPTYTNPSDKEAPYWIIGVVVIVVFFICAILFESLRLPLIIISIIPVSFIGIFLTFCTFNIEFGTGGLASMVMLAGIVINSGIYILNEYRLLRKQSRVGTSSAVRLYVKAYNHKIIPVLLTILSTVFGLIPFFFDGEKAEPFWLSFASGVVGGLMFSLLVIVFILPIIMPLKSIRRH